MSEEAQGFRPFVQVAALCHTALIENNGALTIVRITDRIGVAGLKPEMDPQPINLTLVVVLKSGFLRGQFKISVCPIAPPDGQKMQPVEFPALFEGEDRGVQLVMPMGFVAPTQGLYWFEVAVEGDVLTRVPLRVMYQQIQMPPGGFPLPGMPGTPPV